MQKRHSTKFNIFHDKKNTQTNRLDIEGTYLKRMKTIYVKLTLRIISNGEKRKASPLRSGNKSCVHEL